MSYTFSRRDFMKYTALTAVAVASAGMFTGCGENPNQPSKVFNGTADVDASFGGSTGGFMGIGATHDKHILLKDGTKFENDTLTCAFSHRPVSEGTSCTESNYQVLIVNDEGAQYCVNGKNGVTFTCSNPSGSIKISDASLLPVKNTVTITGLPLTGAKKVIVQYFPRHNALGNDKDSYADVFASWDVSAICNL